MKRKVLLNIWTGLMLKGEQVKLLKQNRWNRREVYMEIGSVIYLRNLVIKQDKIPILVTRRQKLKIRQYRTDGADFHIVTIKRLKRRFQANLIVYKIDVRKGYRNEYKREGIIPLSDLMDED